MQSTHLSKDTPGSGGAVLADRNPDPSRQDLALARWAGWLVAGVGGVILAGWLADVPLLRSLLPQQVEAKANTAVGFILTGVALALKSGRSRPVAANLCAALATLIGLGTLGEYLFRWNLGIDELLFRDSVNAAYTVHPGRMAPPTALNFVLLGTALLVLEAGRNRALVSWLVAPAAALAGLGFIGQLYDLPFLASFGPFTPIAAPTGATFLILCAGLLLAGSGRVMARIRRSGRLLGFTAALLLLLVMAGAVVRNTYALIHNNRRVTHTHEVLGKLTGMLSALQDVETGTRGYLLTGNQDFLEHHAPATAAAYRLLRELRSLTVDNPVQQRRLDRLETLIAEKTAGARNQIILRQQGDTAGALANVAAGGGKQLMDDIRGVVGELQGEEQRLLQERQALSEASTLRTLLTLGSGLAVSVGLMIIIFTLLRREITARQRSEESLAVTLHSIGDAVLATDAAGRITLLNRVAEQLTGWTNAEARGRPVAEVFCIINEETRASSPIPVEAVLATGEIKGLANHTALIARDGTERSIADSAAPIRDAGGKVLGVVLVFRDVSAEQAARRALRESEARYRTLFNSIDEGFCIIEMIFDVQGKPVDYRFLEINQSFEQQTGMKDAVGRRMREFAPEHEAHWFETFGRVARTGEAIRFQNRAEQLRRTYDVYAFRLGNPKDGRVGILFNDITLRKQAEEDLDRFFNLSLDFLCIAGMDGTFKRVSPAVTDILGWTVDEFLARPYMEQIHPDDRAASAREVERQAGGQKVMHFENRFQHKDGSWRVLSWRSMPHGDKMFATARDVTEQKRTQQELLLGAQKVQAAYHQQQAANAELESFSYSVSHDLRAPLRHIQGYVEMLTRETQANLSDKARRYLQTITDAAREMGELIDDLLAFSRMGRTEMSERTVDLSALVTEVQVSLATAARGRDIRWKLGPLPPVRGDAAMLRLALANLLGNAVKYTRPRATAEIEIGADGGEDGRIVCFVRDNGAGFDMQYAGKLFGVFQRLHRADEFEGTGIGLASVRRIITRHGGRTWAQGRLNAGATFYFTLAPATAGQPLPPAQS